MSGVILRPGDPAPWFKVASLANPNYAFNSVAGRYVVLGFLGSMGRHEIQDAWRKLIVERQLFNDQRIALFGISVDPEDQAQSRIMDDLPGIRFFLDFDLAVSRLYGVADAPTSNGQNVSYRPQWIVLDPMLRILAILPLNESQKLGAYLAKLPPTDLHSGTEVPAPVLIVPRIFERDFCQSLIALYKNGESEDSGFMRESEGKTVAVTDYGFKRRRDHHITDESVRDAARARMIRRLVPEIRKAFQFQVTRMERYIVACYEAVTDGHFRPHRDDTTKGTAHRRFAVSINLNAEEYEGGDLRFPEFGSRTYRPPTGGAVVFSCSLLHEATTVTRGTRYAFLPFLYNEEAAKIREQNNAFLGEGVSAYRME